MTPLLEKNEIITLEISSLSGDGSGVGHYEGFAVFVPRTAAGDVILCRIVKVHSSYAFGRIEKIISPSCDRIQNDCEYFTRCGGCVYRHIKRDAELAAKDKFVRDAFLRIGGLEPEFLPVWGDKSRCSYRNKLQMPFTRDKEGNIRCGFYSERSHNVVPIKKCLLQPDIFAEIAGFTAEIAEKLKISVYNENSHTGVLRHLYLRQGYYSGEISVCIVARKNFPEIKKMAALIMNRFPDVVGVVLNINRDKTNVILGEEEITIRGRSYINDKMNGNSLRISPKSFYQINTPAAEKLYECAAEFAKPEGKTLLDLYCGIGTVGLSMFKKAKKVVGVEIVKEAVDNCLVNAKLNDCRNAEFLCLDTEDAVKSMLENNLSPDIVLLDPPRKGCSPDVLSSCAKMNPEKIVMISCNPASAARDCKLLSELGYITKKVRAFDLFPGTKHVETVVLMSWAEK